MMHDPGNQAAAEAHRPAGEHDTIHVVPPSWQPLLLAIGLTMTLAGLLVAPWMWIAGLVLSIIAIVNWLTELRRDYHPAGHDED